MTFYIKNHEKNIWVGKLSLFSEENVEHAFSTRYGGVSCFPYESFNMAFHVGDTNECVKKNRRSFLRALNLDSVRICATEQVHGDKIYCVSKNDIGKGAFCYDDVIKETDALITNEKNVPLLMCFADCVPILFFDKIRNVIAIAHAGWKGTVKKIGMKTILKMGEKYGTMPKDVLIGIGPSIGACCFEVGSEVCNQFKENFPKNEREFIIEKEGAFFIDLWEANRLQLIEVGVLRKNIEIAKVCTQCNPNIFYSYRFDKGKTGRFAAIISLK